MSTRTAPTWSMCTSTTCARSSTGRSGGPRSRRCAAPAIGCAPTAGRLALLDPAQLRRALRGPILVDVQPASGGTSLRVLAEPVESAGRRLVVAVGAALEERERAVDELDALLGIGGPLLVLVAS